MYDRIFKNWKTSLLGLIILAVGFLLVWSGKTTLSELSIFLVASLPLFLTNDKNLPPPSLPNA